MSRGSWGALACAWSTLACASVTTNPIEVDTRTVAMAAPSDCPRAPKRDERLNPLEFWVANQPVMLHAGDEVWMFEIRDRTAWYRTGWSGAARAKRRYTSFGERRGFEVTLTCGDDTYTFEELECPTDDGLIVYVAGQTLGSLGSVDAACQLRVELAADGQRWVHVEDGVLVRPNVRPFAVH